MNLKTCDDVRERSSPVRRNWRLRHVEESPAHVCAVEKTTPAPTWCTPSCPCGRRRGKSRSATTAERLRRQGRTDVRHHRASYGAQLGTVDHLCQIWQQGRCWDRNLPLQRPSRSTRRRVSRGVIKVRKIAYTTRIFHLDAEVDGGKLHLQLRRPSASAGVLRSARSLFRHPVGDGFSVWTGA